MRARLLLIAAIAAAGCRSSGRDAPPAPPPAHDAGAAPAPPPSLATCDRYVEALAEAADQGDVSPGVAAVLRNEHDLLAVALRAPPADRADLALRCATGLVRLARLSDEDEDDRDQATGLGSLAAVPAPMTAAPDAGPAGPADAGLPDANLGTTGMPPACARLIAVLDRMAGCPALPADMRSTLRQSRELMRDSYAHVPRHMRATVDESCRSAVRSYDQVLAEFGCP